MVVDCIFRDFPHENLLGKEISVGDFYNMQPVVARIRRMVYLFGRSPDCLGDLSGYATQIAGRDFTHLAIIIVTRFNMNSYASVT